MTFTTPPFLGIFDLDADEGVVLSAYQGIKIGLIPAGGATLRYSKVDEPNATGHLGTPVDVTTETTIEVEWPYYYVDCSAGSGRVALI